MASVIPEAWLKCPPCAGQDRPLRPKEALIDALEPSTWACNSPFPASLLPELLAKEVEEAHRNL